MEITSFTKEYRFLSNMALVPIWFEGAWYRSVEHAYQAAKSLDESNRQIIRYAPLPYEAKKLAQKIKLREDWEDVKYDIMKSLVTQKFENNFEFRDKLLATGTATLIEGNYWNDTYWGMIRTRGEQQEWEGQNNLGKILMEIRTSLRSKFGLPV